MNSLLQCVTRHSPPPPIYSPSPLPTGHTDWTTLNTTTRKHECVYVLVCIVVLLVCLCTVQFISLNSRREMRGGAGLLSVCKTPEHEDTQRQGCLTVLNNWLSDFIIKYVCVCVCNPFYINLYLVSGIIVATHSWTNTRSSSGGANTDASITSPRKYTVSNQLHIPTGRDVMKFTINKHTDEFFYSLVIRCSLKCRVCSLECVLRWRRHMGKTKTLSTPNLLERAHAHAHFNSVSVFNWSRECNQGV